MAQRDLQRMRVPAVAHVVDGIRVLETMDAHACNACAVRNAPDQLVRVPAIEG
jgi:hypothetical protein